jgi:para-aminobenzoate synthetase component 1
LIKETEDKPTWQSFLNRMNALGSAKIPFIFIIDFEKEKPMIFPLDGLPPNLYYSIHSKGHFPPKQTLEKDLKFSRNPIALEVYDQAFRKVKQEIEYGNTFLINLTFENEIQTNFSLLDIFNHCSAPYQLFYDDQFVVFSPESFVKIKDQKIYTFPMKGTINAEEENAAQKILENEKELQEHYTIVDLLRNDLNLVAKNVKVDKFRYIDKIENNFGSLLQVSSSISGDLPENYKEQLGDIFNKLLPAGSICGAPKKKTVEIIQGAERRKRGYYTGVFGVFDGQDLDSGVMIRFIKKEQNKLYYCSGGGITFQSEMEKEFIEMKDKIYVPII